MARRRGYMRISKKMKRDKVSGLGVSEWTFGPTPEVDIAPTEKPIERQELTFLELRARIWTPGELAEYPISNLRQLKREVRQAISISPFDTGLRTEEQLLSKAIRCSNDKG